MELSRVVIHLSEFFFSPGQKKRNNFNWKRYIKIKQTNDTNDNCYPRPKEERQDAHQNKKKRPNLASKTPPNLQTQPTRTHLQQQRKAKPNLNRKQLRSQPKSAPSLNYLRSNRTKNATPDKKPLQKTRINTSAQWIYKIAKTPKKEMSPPRCEQMSSSSSNSTKASSSISKYLSDLVSR